MLDIKNVNVYGLNESLIRSGYPMQVGDPTDMANAFGELYKDVHHEFPIDDNDAITRAKKLGKVPTGTGHDNFLKGVIVQFDVKYPQYWTSHFQRYTFADIISSQSKMHRLTKVEKVVDQCNEYTLPSICSTVDTLITLYDIFDFSDKPLIIEGMVLNNRKELFMAIVSNLPMGYEMWMGVTTNYLQLKTIYQQRRNHKLDDWQTFCNWVESLPEFLQLIGKENENSD